MAFQKPGALGISLSVLLALAPASLLSAASTAARLENVQLDPEGAGSVLRLELSRATAHRFFVLDAPRRAVIDLESTRAASGLRWPTAAPGVRALRSGVRQNEGLRVVVELDGAAAATLRPPAGSGARQVLVIEIGGSGAARGVAAAVATTPAAGSATAVAETARPVRAAHAPPESGRDVIVAIDAGHGGVDPGAIGRGGTREKDVVLEIARALAERIDREPGMRAFLTRDGDYFLSLRQRIRRARDGKADLFVSVHADSVRDRAVSGSSVYILSTKGASDEQARWLAERENAADLKGGISLDDKDETLATVLLDLAQSASISASMEAAERVLRRLNSVNEARRPMVQQAGFVVLKSPDIPSILVETAFISNVGDERRLRDDAYRQRLAEAIFRGVRGYFEDYPPEGTLFAARRRQTDPPLARNER
jgi:N-acetylmuramoyl-L-alanine amidase